MTPFGAHETSLREVSLAEVSSLLLASVLGPIRVRVNAHVFDCTGLDALQTSADPDRARSGDVRVHPNAVGDRDAGERNREKSASETWRFAKFREPEGSWFQTASKPR